MWAFLWRGTGLVGEESHIGLSSSAKVVPYVA